MTARATEMRGFDALHRAVGADPACRALRHGWSVTWTLGVVDALGSDDAPYLSACEEQASRRFRFARDRALYRTAHLLKRLVHAAVLEVAPETLAYRYDQNGKPHLAWPVSLPFSLSHGGHCVAVTTSRAGRCGVDIEAEDEAASATLAWSDLLHPGEAKRLGGRKRPGPDRVSTLWTLKEAAAKTVGFGLSLPLGDIETPLVETNAPFASDPFDIVVHGAHGCRLAAVTLAVRSPCGAEHRLSVANSGPVRGFIFRLIGLAEPERHGRFLFASCSQPSQDSARPSKAETIAGRAAFKESFP